MPERPSSSADSSATFFVGVRPPTALSARVVAWQHSLRHVVTAPHITLKAPGPLSSPQLRACQQVCQHTPPFELHLGSVQTFGERVVFLEASGDGLSALHAALVAALGEPAGEFELAGYRPHLTLALCWRPLRLPWPDVLASAQTEFADLAGTPLRCTVQQAALFRKDLPGQPYEVSEQWTLGG